MAEFAYVAVDDSGKQKKGIIEANNLDQARANLKGQGLTPISVDVPNALNKEISFNIGGKVKSGDLALFCKQFQSILHAGVTVIQALEMLEDQAENKKLHDALTEVRTLVEKGDTLAGAMGTRDDVFPKILIHMVEAGETSGSLETALERMAVHFEKDSKIKNMVTQAMIYPIILLVVIIGVVILMLVKVVPSFQETFDQAGGKLPAITLAVVAMSNMLIKRWYIFVGVIAVIVIGIRVFMKTESGAQFFGRLIIKLPVFGDMVIKQACARLARTLSTLLASGISMVGAIDIVAKIMTNRIVQVVVEDARGSAVPAIGAVRSVPPVIMSYDADR